MAELADISQTVAEFTALAKSQLAGGDLAAAEQTARAVIALAPKQAEGWRALGQVLSSAPGRRGEAAEAFQKALVLEPGNPEAEGGKAALSARATAAPQKKPAAPRIPQLAALSGKDELIAAARTAETAERWQEAKSAWQKVLKLDPSDTWAWSQYGHLLSVNMHNFTEAEAAFRRAIEEDPTDDWAWGKLGIMIADFQGRVKEGQEMLREAIRLDPSEPYYHGWLGWSLYRQSENLQEAEVELELAVKLQPQYQWAYFHLGYVRYATGKKPEAALKAYLKAVELDPQDIASLFNLAVLYEEQLGRINKAIQTYEQALVQEPDHAACHFKLAVLYEQKEGGLQKAKYHYQQILLHNPQDLSALRCLAYLYYEKLQSFDDAQQLFEEALRLAPEDADLHYRYGCMLWYDLDQADEGIDHLRRATELAPDIELGWASLGEALATSKGEYTEAEACYRKALELEPDYHWVMTHYGTLLCEHLDRPGDGLQMLKAAVEGEEDYSWGWLELGRAEKRHFANIDAARAAFEQALRAEPDEVRPLFELVQLYFDELNRPDLAEEYCRKLTDLAPESGLVWAMLGFIYRYRKDAKEEAKGFFEKALELQGDHHWILHTYAEHMLYDWGDQGEAEAYLLKADKADHDCATVYADLGLIRLSQGEFDIARAFVEKAMEEDPDDATCWRLYGRFLYLTDGDPGLIEESFDRAIEEWPQNFENHMCLAVYLRECGDRAEEAEAAWNRAAELAPPTLDLDTWAALQMNPLILRK